ncbi:MAG: methylmalonyl Co-A mutase-associated GTPase MeaB [Bacteroidetes bacterium]|nr:methylmalonyl Co-A mutase-associated GTPase MeaB [Bacteroidota bacterium]
MSRRQIQPISYYNNGILQGNRVILSQAITLVESQKQAHQELAAELVNGLLPHAGKSMRIGITGVPGAGKSSLIETLGMHAISAGKKVAVLAIDPSSAQTKGSILGDKTRMESLANHSNAFIRPSAAGSQLGGVAQKTRESMLLCEAAGYNLILIETVGVGQSEVAVSQMVDFFLLVLITGAGDELQGIKRGVMEMADLIAINKADGQNLPLAKQQAIELNRALSLFPKRTSGYKPHAIPVSAYEALAIDVLWAEFEAFFSKYSEQILTHRKAQNVSWMHQSIEQMLIQNFYNHNAVKQQLAAYEKEIEEGNLSSYQAALKLIQLFGQ